MAKKQTKKKKTTKTTKPTKKRGKGAKTTKKAPVKKVKRVKNKDVVITSPINPDSQIVIASELADDSLIESELMGEVLPYFVYQFKQGDKNISGLTVKGVNEVVRRLNRNKKSGYKITFPPQNMKVERDVEYDGQKGVEVTVLAVNLIDSTSAWGIKFEPYKKTKKKGGTYTNDFAVEKALSKAERNAKRKLIPETVAVKMIEKLMREGDKNIQQLNAPPVFQTKTVTPQRPQASSQEEIESMILDGIKYAKVIDIVIQIDQQTQASDKFSSKFKKKVHQVANKRGSELDIS